MAKKLTDTVNEHDQQLAQAVRTSAQQIWQAGLGAFVKAQQEQGEGAADQRFEQLVAEGSVLQQRVRATGDGHEQGQGQAQGPDEDEEGAAAARSWDTLEQVFEDRVVRALGAIGVPSKRDLDALAAQLAQLSTQVTQLQRELAAQRALSGQGQGSTPPPGAASD